MDQSITDNPEFSEWAQLKSGCDGGNLEGAIWLCGMEWGKGNNPNELNFKDGIERLKNDIPQWSDKDLKDTLNNSYNYYCYDNRAFKLLSVM